MSHRTREAKILARSIERLREAARIRRHSRHGTPQHERAAIDEKRFNADVIDLLRERSRT